MSNAARNAASTGPQPGRWAIRVAVLGALAATLWFAGPRAWRVASAHLSTDTGGGVPVAFDRVGAFSGPAWLEGALLQTLLEDLEPRLRGEVRLMDDAAARAARERLLASPFVTDVRLERRFPDRFRIELAVRRPEVQVVADGRVVALVDGDGTALPPGRAALDLPRVGVDGYRPPVPCTDIAFGAAFPDLRVVVAASVAREWRSEVTPALGDRAPPLRYVDGRNAGWEWIEDPDASQLLVGVGRDDGATCWFHYGVAGRDGGAVDAATRAEILGLILAEYPGLRGVIRGDLRMRNLWRDYLRVADR